MALHKGESVTCTICNRKFDSSDSLAMHAAVHTEVGQSQQQQQQQIMLIQKQEELGGEARQPGDAVADPLEPQKPYQCQHCGRRFTRPHEKVKHERIHTGEKPHACEVRSQIVECIGTRKKKNYFEMPVGSCLSIIDKFSKTKCDV